MKGTGDAPRCTPFRPFLMQFWSYGRLNSKSIKRLFHPIDLQALLILLADIVKTAAALRWLIHLVPKTRGRRRVLAKVLSQKIFFFKGVIKKVPPQGFSR